MEDAPETVDVAAQKKWADTLSHADDTVTLRLKRQLRRRRRGARRLPGRLQRDAGGFFGDVDGFAHTWSSLPKNYIADGSVSAITYTVSELSGGSAVAQGGRAVIGARAYTVAYGTESGVLTVTNTLRSELLLKKTSSGGKALSGAVFLLQRQTGESAWSNVGTYTTGADGTVILPALADGKYLLTETVAPRGYNLLAAPVAFTVTNAAVYRGSDSLVDAATGGNILTVTDTPVYSLPSTGGKCGSAALIAAGAALILGVRLPFQPQAAAWKITGPRAAGRAAKHGYPLPFLIRLAAVAALLGAVWALLASLPRLGLRPCPAAHGFSWAAPAAEKARAPHAILPWCRAECCWRWLLERRLPYPRWRLCRRKTPRPGGLPLRRIGLGALSRRGRRKPSGGGPQLQRAPGRRGHERRRRLRRGQRGHRPHRGILEAAGAGRHRRDGHLVHRKPGPRLPIYHGTGEDALSAGVGHIPGSSLPVGGADTHAVLTAHTGPWRSFSPRWTR